MVVLEGRELECSPGCEPARATITIAFGAQVRTTIEGAPDAATLSTVIGALDGARSIEMIAFPSGARVRPATGHTDMRKGFDLMALLVQETLKRDPHAGDLDVFRGRRGELDQVDLA